MFNILKQRGCSTGCLKCGLYAYGHLDMHTDILTYGCMDIYYYLDIWIYIYTERERERERDRHEHIPALRGCLRCFVFQTKNTHPLDVEHVYVQFSRCFIDLRSHPGPFSKSLRSGQMTVPAKCASKLSAKRSAVLLLIIL